MYRLWIRGEHRDIPQRYDARLSRIAHGFKINITSLAFLSGLMCANPDKKAKHAACFETNSTLHLIFSSRLKRQQRFLVCATFRMQPPSRISHQVSHPYLLDKNIWKYALHCGERSCPKFWGNTSIEVILKIEPKARIVPSYNMPCGAAHKKGRDNKVFEKPLGGTSRLFEYVYI